MAVTQPVSVEPVSVTTGKSTSQKQVQKFDLTVDGGAERVPVVKAGSATPVADDDDDDHEVGVSEAGSDGVFEFIFLAQAILAQVQCFCVSPKIFWGLTTAVLLRVTDFFG